jgi:hypothetical protein
LADLQKSANQQVADMMGQALANVHLFGDDDEDGERGERAGEDEQAEEQNVSPKEDGSEWN